MSAPPPVLTVTLNPAIDLNLCVPELFTDEFTRATAVRRGAGGKGVNVARVLAALGVGTTALVAVGGPDAEVYLSLLADAPFEVARVPTGGPTRTNVTISGSVGERLRHLKVNQPGPTWLAGDWSALCARIERELPGRRWLVLAGSLPPGVRTEGYAELAVLAGRAGVRVALDCAGPSLETALAAHPALIKPNRAELSETLGRPVESREDTVRAARELQRRGAGWVIVSAGDQICEAIGPEDTAPVAMMPPRLERPGSPMGAGDALLAGWLAAELQGRPPREMLELAVACGAATAALPDTEFPDRARVDSMLERVRAAGG